MKAQLIFILDGLGEPQSPSTLERSDTPFLDRLTRQGEMGQIDLGWSEEDPTSEKGILRLCGKGELSEVYSRAILLYAARMEEGPLSEEDRWVWLLNPASVRQNRLESYVEDGPVDIFWRNFLEIAATHPRQFEYLPVSGANGQILRLLATHPVDGQSPGLAFLPQSGATIPSTGLVASLLEEASSFILKGGPFNCVWPWGMGKWDSQRMVLPEKTVNRWMIAGAPLSRALGKVMGWMTPPIPGATGDVDTSIEAKGKALMEALGREETTHVVCHLEGFDLSSHRKNVGEKIGFLERFDRVMGPLIQDCLEKKRVEGVWLTCDHLSSPQTGNHEKGPVPFLHLFPGKLIPSDISDRGKWTEKRSESGLFHTTRSWKTALGF